MVILRLIPHSFVSPDALEGNIKDINSQYTRGDTPCTTYIRWRFIANLNPFSLQMLWRAILRISYRNIHEVIPCTTYSWWRFISNLTPFSLQNATECNIKEIISQYVRGDTPCTTCSRLRFISNLTLSLLAPWWCQPRHRQTINMVVRRNAFALWCSACHISLYL